MGGIREQTYWTSGNLHPESEDLTDALEANLSFLEPHEDFLREFVATGGEIEYFVGWIRWRNAGLGAVAAIRSLENQSRIGCLRK